MAIKFLEKNVTPNAQFTTIEVGEKEESNIYVIKVNFSQGYNFYHFRLLSSYADWGIALSEAAIELNTADDGTFNYRGDGILCGYWTNGLILTQPMLQSFYLIVTAKHENNMIKIAASNSSVYPFIDCQ